MSRILARQTERGRKTSRPDTFEADETYAGYRAVLMQLRPKRGRQLVAHHSWIDSIVDQQPPFDGPVNPGHSHVFASSGLASMNRRRYAGGGIKHRSWRPNTRYRFRATR